MWQSNSQNKDTKRTADVACHSCRKRKVKCDREQPCCQVCIETGQYCEYPERVLKPGPKIGSLQRRGRRYRDRCQSKATDQQNRSNDSASPIDQTGVERSIVVDVSHSERRQSFASSSSRRKSDAQDQNAGHKASKLNIHDLSFILHPSHEVTTPDEEPPTAMSVESADVDNQRLFQSACQCLGLSKQSVEKMVRIYFDNMVAINLFHEPTFTQTLHSITSESHLVALLAAICAYSVRFVPFEAELELEQELSWGSTGQKTPTLFLNLSSQQIDKALNECTDDPPPLCVLQALIVTTHCQLTQGVRGRAWRALGTCVRLAYELNLHLLDSRYAVEQYDYNTQRWCEDEEKRRAWWAIWEMDVFASTIRRTPTAISWSQMEVLLPAPDTNWYQDTPVGSCFLEQEPGQRWKALQESGNVSPKAWFIVINSLMKDAQVISCPRGVPSVTRPGQSWQQNPKGEGRQSISYQAENSEESRQKLETLANSVYCLVRVLPENLRYRQQHLSFSPRLPGQVESSRQLHCSIYNIYVMTQLARLMIHRYDVFGSQTKPAQPPAMSAPCKLGFASFQDQESPALREYFESADNVLSIVNRSCEDHIRHINPFLPSTIWLAAAVQMVRKQFGGPSTYNSLIKARFDVLYLTYKQCVSFWGIQTAMQQNLETIEAQLEDFNGKPTRSFPGTTTQPAWSGVSNSAQRWIPPLDTSDGSKVARHPCNGQNVTHQAQPHEIQKPLATGDVDSLGNKGMQSSGALPKTPPESEHGEQLTRSTMQGADMSPKTMSMTQSMDQIARDPLNATFCADADGAMTSMPMLEFMLMPPQASAEMHDMGDSTMMDAWKDMELPSDIRDLLSGFSTY
ncbi:fungal-specific transcription factor domain-containing protein [Fusarium sp. MPI-SDFR-AT-0072]|nr:fungal-specific transcription factor domain-containing protein [Fusarium sp. MPI-SDFR-AT-0072]